MQRCCNRPLWYLISYVEEALKYIEANYSEAVTIQDLANWLGLERTYLYRLFKSMVGMSPRPICWTCASARPARC